MQVTVHNDAFPKDQEFEIPGLGLVTNHQAKEVDANQVGMYESFGLKFPKDGNLVIDQNPPVSFMTLDDAPEDDEDDTEPAPAVGSGAVGAPKVDEKEKK
jgi:hypothetical protein